MLAALCAAVLLPGSAAATATGPVISEFNQGLTPGVGLWGITSGPDGNLWFTEETNNAVGRITPGAVITEFTAGFPTGSPQGIEKIDTIADSLGAPYALPISFALCRASLEEVVRIQDAEMIAAMRFLFQHARLAVEPAGAAATAALLGPLRERLAGLRVGLIVCGSNIAAEAYAHLIGP